MKGLIQVTTYQGYPSRCRLAFLFLFEETDLSALERILDRSTKTR